MYRFLKLLNQSKLFQEIDLQFANILISHTQPELMFAVSYLSKFIRDGHICLPISQLNPKKIFHDNKTLLNKINKFFSNNINWEKKLLSYTYIVSDGKGIQITPFILENKCFYMYRIWKLENNIINHFLNNKYCVQYITQIKNHLNNIFYDIDNMQQKIAIITALMHRISIITGSPGTGKTTIIAKIILSFIKIKKNIIINVIAFTGKAANRITESLNMFFSLLPISVITPEEAKQIPHSATTIHNFFKINIYKKTTIFNQQNQLNTQLLIVDEASMIDLHLMSIILDSLPKNSSLVLLGDEYQLSPINTGYLLQDICYFKKFNITKAYNHFLTTILITIKTSKNNTTCYIRNCINTLTKNYRYKHSSGIHKLALSIKKKRIKDIQDIFLTNKYLDVQYININNIETYNNMIQNHIIYFKQYFCYIKHYNDIQNIDNYFHNLKNYQILCAIKNSLFGTSIINNKLDNIFSKQEHSLYYMKSMWYPGKPIIITKNNHLLNLFNGDIGITIWNKKKKKLEIIFQLPYHKYKFININELPEHEISYAITIHKAQGSEFNHVALILPNKFTSILNRELIYTAITRAKKKIYIFSPYNIFFQTLQQKIKRYSNIRKKLLLHSIKNL
ncbi:exodeoxyribonuclease V subunit alpha [Enterobacteriaceae endosymbiont of Macroplea appendiculata]|uniref:exodeoxyribonuclease V subunit alpha n=1 Tax=Enterobacteriaceae endosymbiont of Macroplea appendiculata TaxID=2675790 RepID=UPI00144A1CDC|nr:exodeoxyribonuclease V subunit alpha [Enterobacteriaceae endosymbiont of Macroplea appendiculata]QJC30996.1 exodeoxyribonuclease V subunit alpha [Enterobacteriaceae endosymbiont of Macroplea appendiculata]